MHLFQFNTLVHLSFHAIAFALLFVCVMGIPGNPDDTEPVLKRLMTAWGMLLLVGWKGIPVLATASVVAFFFHYDLLGQIISYISLGIGISLFSTLFIYYILQSRYQQSKRK